MTRAPRSAGSVCPKTWATLTWSRSPKLVVSCCIGENLAGCWLLVAGCWLLVAGCWLLVAGCWLLVAGCWLLVAGCVGLSVFAVASDQQPATSTKSVSRSALHVE